MIKIGLTGSVASGKTTASKIISMRRGPLFSADKVVKKLYTQNKFKKTSKNRNYRKIRWVVINIFKKKERKNN